MAMRRPFHRSANQRGRGLMIHRIYLSTPPGVLVKTSGYFVAPTSRCQTWKSYRQQFKRLRTYSALRKSSSLPPRHMSNSPGHRQHRRILSLTWWFSQEIWTPFPACWLFLGRSDLDFAVRCAGMESASARDILVSMAAFDSFEFDRQSESITIGAGQTWAAVDNRMERFAPGYAGTMPSAK